MKTEELLKTLAEKREALRVTRFSFAGAGGKNVKASRELRKDVARILSEIKSRQFVNN